MPSQTLLPLAKNVVKYGAIMGGGKLLYDHSLALCKPFTDLCAQAPAPMQTGWAKFAMGVAALGVAHFVLSKTAQRKARRDHFAQEAAEKGEGDAPPAETPAPPDTGEEPKEPTPKPRGSAGPLIAGIIAILPKTAIAVAGGQLTISTVALLEGIYNGIGARVLALPGMDVFNQNVRAALAHPLCCAAGLALILLGYAIVRRGIVKRHGPVHRSIIVNDRRVESLHWDTQKIRGFGLQLQTADTEGIIGDLTPTADTYVTTFDHDGKHKGRTCTIMYLKNLEPQKTALDKLDGSHVTAVRDAIQELYAGKTVSAADLETIEIEKLGKTIADKKGQEMSDTDLGRVLLALMSQGGEDVSKADEGRLLAEINDVEVGYEGGLFHRVLYRRDAGGHYVPDASLAEDLTLTDRVSSSPTNGFGPTYWRRGKVLMGFWFAKSAGEDADMIRMPVHEIRKSRLRRYWDWGPCYRWTFLKHNLRVDECWLASYPVPFTPIKLRRFYTVRDSHGEIVATMRELFWSKLTLDMNWRIEIYCDRLNDERAGNTLALLTEFLHNRKKYIRSRTTLGNTAHERLLVGGGKKRGDATEAIGGGL